MAYYLDHPAEYTRPDCQVNGSCSGAGACLGRLGRLDRWLCPAGVGSRRLTTHDQNSKPGDKILILKDK